ncbi:MAG: EamA family transporter [Firmicutes bacterium]|nr:EamA family transporter [Bacillota bacterium]
MKKNGTIYVMLAAVLFSIGGLCIKMIPWGAMAINGGRNLIAVPVLLLYIKLTGHKLRMNRAVVFGAVCMCAVTTLFTLANKLTTAANTIILQFTAPIFAMIMTWFLLRKKPQRIDVITCMVVFVGIIFFFIDGISAGNQLGNILALLSGIAYAGVFMMNSFEQSDSLSSILYGQMLSAVIGIGFVFKETDFSASVLLLMAALGLLQLALAYIFMAKGLETVNAVTASLTAAIEPVLNPILVAIFYKERITGLALIGAVIVLGTVLIYNVRQARLEDTQTQGEQT